MTLRVTVDLHDGVECRVSLAARLAYANRYPSLRDFLAVNGIGIKALETGQPAAVAMLADWAGTDPERLKGNDIQSRGVGDIWQLGEASMSRDMRTGFKHRYCPKCVTEDIRRGSGRLYARPYVRASWLTRAVQSCSSHSVPIVEVPDPEGGRDFPRYVEANLALIEREAATAEGYPSMGLENYVERRISGVSDCDFLDGLEAYVAIDLCRNLGRFVIERSSDYSDQPPSWHLETSRGYSIAKQGVAAIESAVASAVQVKKPLAVEMNWFFGKLRRWLLRNQKKPEFAPVVELFQEIAERNLPIGEDDTFILPTRQRHLHSVRSASIEYGISDDRVYQLAVEAGLTDRVDLTSGRIYLDAHKTHEVLSAALETITAPEIASDLGLHIDRLRPFFEANLLARVEAPRDGTRVFSRVRRSDFEAFKLRLNAPLATPSEAEKLVPVGRAAQTLFCTLLEIIQLAAQRKLLSLRRLNQEGFISGLGVDLAELEPLISSRMSYKADANLPVFDQNDPASPLLNTAQARQILQAATCTVTDLLNRNRIKRVRGVNLKTRKVHDYICRRSVESFQDKHISLAHLAERKRMFAVTVRDKLADLGVKPIYEPSGRNSRYYRKLDVLDLIF